VVIILLWRNSVIRRVGVRPYYSSRSSLINNWMILKVDFPVCFSDIKDYIIVFH
jgi:hypothetical protein